MAESTLSFGYDELEIAVAYFLYGKDPGDLTAAQDVVVDAVIQTGYRQFIYPPATEGVPLGYTWTFLHPTTTIDTITTYDTGTLEVSAGTCTITTGTWPSWAATHGTLTIDGTEYSITSRDSDAELTVVGDDVAAGEEDWTLEHNGNQDLPDDFGRLVDGFTFEVNAQVVNVLADVGEGKIRRLRVNMDEINRPRVAGIRVKAIEDDEGQRKEVMWYPRPDDVYTMSYKYEAFVGKLETTNYPLGGMSHSETIKLSCLAAADALVNDNYGIHWENFLRQLVSSVHRDMKEQTQQFGDVGTKNTYERYGDARPFGYGLTVNGTRIE